MAGTTKEKSIDRQDIIYDEPILDQLVEEYGTAIEIKRHVDTSAKIYEIRTAVQYWFGGEDSYYTSSALWDRLSRFERGVPKEVLE